MNMNKTNELTRLVPARTLFNEMEKFFEPYQTTFPLSRSDVFAADWMPAVDIKDEKDKFVIHADIPGVCAKDIDIQLEHNVLTIKGCREIEKREEQLNFVHTERSKGTFMRRFSLPDSVDPDHIDAKTKDGILMIVLRKTKANGAKRISVKEE